MGPPVDHLALPLACDHVEQRLPEVVPDAAVADHLVPEDDEAQVVDVLYVVLLHVHSVLRAGAPAGHTMSVLSCYYQCFVLGFAFLTSTRTHHVHEYVPDHNHGRLVVIPGLV